MDEFTRECLCIRVGRKPGSADVIDVLADLSIARGAPAYVRSDNGPEFVAVAVKTWISGVGAKTAFIEPGSPWENGHVEGSNGKPRDKLLNVEVFNGSAEARVLIEQWRTHYNTVRPHSSLGYRPPAPEVVLSGLPTMPPRSDRITPAIRGHAALTFCPDHQMGAGHDHRHGSTLVRAGLGREQRHSSAGLIGGHQPASQVGQREGYPGAGGLNRKIR